MVTVTVGSNNTVRYLESVKTDIRQSLLKAMTRIGIGLQAYIQTKKLEGQVLQHRSGKLIGSIRQHVVDEGSEIVVVVQGGGGVAPYGYVHEYGGTYLVPTHWRTSKLGNPYQVRPYNITFPERSYMRSSLEENEQWIVEQIERAIKEAL